MFIYFFLIYKKISDKHVCTVVLNLPEVICKELYSFIQEESKGRLSTICKCMKCSNQVCRGIKQIASKFSHYNLNQLSMSIENIIITPREDIFSLSATNIYVRLQIHFDAGKLFHTILQILSNCYMK